MSHKVIIGLPCWRLQGSTVFAEKLLRGLIRQGYDASILLTELNCDRVPLADHELDLPDDLPADSLPAGRSDTWGQRWEALERYLEERAPCSYLMLHDWRNNIIASRLSGRVKLIGLVQSDSEPELDQIRRIGSYWDAIVSVSEPLHLRLAAQFSYLSPRMLTISHAVSTLPKLPVKSSTKCLQIAYSGEFKANQKRLSDMILIANSLADNSINFKLTFFGDGPYRKHLEESSYHLVKQGLVEFAGYQRNPDLLKALEGQHVFLFTSEYEDLSIAVLEAMSRGCVPVLSNLASQSSLISNEVNALIAQVGDINAFVNQLRRLSLDSQLFSNLSANAYQSVGHEIHGEGAMITRYMDLFDRLHADNGIKNVRTGNRFVSEPPVSAGAVDGLSGPTSSCLDYMERLEHWPNPPRSLRRAITKYQRPAKPEKLSDVRVIVSSLPGAISGVDVFSDHLVRGLRDNGIDARMLVRFEDNQDMLNIPQDMPIIQSVFDQGKDYISLMARWKKLARQLEEMAPCIYIPNYDRDCSCIGPYLSNKVRIVGIGHSDDPWHYEHLFRIGQSCHAIVGVSQAIIEHLSKPDINLAPKLTCIPYGVPLSIGASTRRIQQSKRTDGRLRVIYCGRLVLEQKRVTDLTGIARILVDRGVDFELWIIGDGERAQQMLWDNRDLVRRGNLLFFGRQDNKKVLEMMEECDAFILPSSFEGLSVGMLEAMSRGAIPVVSDIRSGVPEVIEHGHNGLIAPVGACDRFADHLEWLWRHPDKRQEMAESAMTTVAEKFALDRMIDHYVELLQDVAAQAWARPKVPILPPRHLQSQLGWSAWATRVASDPLASARRIMRRFTH